MDILWILLLMVLLYIVPELFKRRSKKYEYPEIPAPEPTAEPIPKLPPTAKVRHVPAHYQNERWNEQPVISSPVLSAESKVVPMPPVNVPTMAQPISPWQDALDSTMVLNGIIFAEILQPPRSKRPLGYCLRHRHN